MFIEVKGTNFVNKGAELMLHAILQKVREMIPEASFVMTLGINDNYLKRTQLGLLKKVWYERYGIQWGVGAQFIPKKLRLHYGLVNDAEIDVVLDASGFAYSDQINKRNSVAMASYVRAWKNRGVKVIILPQAMGPFTSPETCKAFTYVVENADLIFPRDDISYKHVIDLVGERDNVYKAPDFTNLVSSILPSESERFRGRYCLVPNYRMVDKTTDMEGKKYIDFCVKCVKSLVKRGCKPFVLIHEGAKDIALAQEIIDKAKEKIEIVNETNVLVIKGILGLCAGVICSRFHGLVSSLSQGIPSLATGWSHKYAMLFNEYGVPDCCLDVSISQEDLDSRIDKIVNNNYRNEIIQKLIIKGLEQKEQSETMWRRVFAVISR